MNALIEEGKMNTNGFMNNESDLPNMFAPMSLVKALSSSKPMYTVGWIKQQVANIDEHTSIKELTTLLQDTTVTLLQPHISNKQINKARELITQIAFMMAFKASRPND